jgi:hypothetical protein
VHYNNTSAVAVESNLVVCVITFHLLKFDLGIITKHFHDCWS